jgi:hypothetical protein
VADSEQKPAQDPQPAAAGGTEIVITNDQEAPAAYANFARVTGTPEELILDFALNPNPFGSGRQELRVSQRLILNHFTAKRLLAALSATLQRHEAAFGSIELDVRRRVAGGTGQGAAKK